jgi:hypothetical protein
MNWIERTLQAIRGVLEVEAERAIPMWRIEGQIWDLLNGSDADPDQWAWPLDIYVDDDNSLFVIVAQAGKLYRVGLVVIGEEVYLGEWLQVTQVFEPVEQTARFVVRRQTNGEHRWLMVAATSVLNRVGEIDSAALFDSFVRRAERSGRYPRLDFYHLGGTDPDLWEFGTADYLARDGVCYIASGTFDVDHPLAMATVRAAEQEPGKWGASIEFRALSEPELIVADPAVRIPVYKDGENTRISIVLERDAAGWFTRLGVKEVGRMRSEIREKLRELFADPNGVVSEEDEAILAEFEHGSDGINRTVSDEQLIHRSTNGAEAEGEEDGDAEGAGESSVPAPVTGDTQEEELIKDATPEIVLDEEAVHAITTEILRTNVFHSMHEAINAMSRQLTAVTATLEARDAEVAALKTRATSLANRLKALEREDVEKQQEWLEDLPARSVTKVTFRPRHQRQRSVEDEEENVEDVPESLAEAAERTLAMLPDW